MCILYALRLKRMHYTYAYRVPRNALRKCQEIQTSCCQLAENGVMSTVPKYYIHLKATSYRTLSLLLTGARSPKLHEVLVHRTTQVISTSVLRHKYTSTHLTQRYQTRK